MTTERQAIADERLRQEQHAVLQQRVHVLEMRLHTVEMAQYSAAVRGDTHADAITDMREAIDVIKHDLKEMGKP